MTSKLGSLLEHVNLFFLWNFPTNLKILKQVILPLSYAKGKMITQSTIKLIWLVYIKRTSQVIKIRTFEEQFCYFIHSVWDGLRKGPAGKMPFAPILLLMPFSTFSSTFYLWYSRLFSPIYHYLTLYIYMHALIKYVYYPSPNSTPIQTKLG